MSVPRLLLALPREPAVDRARSEFLPEVVSAYADELGPTPWSGVEAALVGPLNRVLPKLRPEDLPSLRFAQSLFTGVDDFPFDRFSPAVIVAGNVGAFAPFVAEHAVSLVLALAKRLLPAHQQVSAGRLRPVTSAQSLLGARVLVLGFGEIGHEVARRLRPFGVHVVGMSRTGGADADADEMVASGQLDEQLRRADVVVNCLPLTRRTYRMIGGPQLAELSPTAIFVNVGRGGTVDEAAFWRFLEHHPTAQCGIDVWWNEDFETGSLPDGRRAAKFPGLLGTPHTAAFTTQSRARAVGCAFANLARFFRGETPLHTVDRSELPQRSGRS